MFIRKKILILFLFSQTLNLFFQSSDALNSCLSIPTLQGPNEIELPLCGNGQLDPDEVCDDGNRIRGDGCNAWCSGFDLMTKACTMAGQNPFYASGDQKQCLGTVGQRLFGPAQALFCNLNAIAVSPDGKYLIVAEGGLLVRMDLFTDAFANSLSILPATLIQPLKRICSIFVIPNGILVHECQEQSLMFFVNDGTQFSTPLVMPQLKAQPTNMKMKSYLDDKEEMLLIAGAVIDEGLTCIQVYGFNITSATGSLLTSIECVVYNVIEKGLVYPSFSISGMIPYQITREGCPFQMQSASCYVIHMQRADMQVFKAYMAVEGGLDMHYTVSTDDSVNVLGAPMIIHNQKSGNKYTLTGNCFTMQQPGNNAVKRPPPMVAFGNACGPMPFQSNNAQCSTPLNNPFITEVATSSYLLPQGLSSTHQHQSLLNIFNATNMPLYRQILDNTHNGTVPIDFVELPNTLDVVYITQTTIGLISTKGIIHMDIFNPGYCRATPLIACPNGFFGSVEKGICTSCNQDTIPTSVSAQIQCAGLPQSQRRRALLGTSLQSAPYLHVGLIVTKDVTQSVLDILTKYYLARKGKNCTSTSYTGVTTTTASSSLEMTSHEPYNMQADYSEAKLQPPEKQLITELIAEASVRDGYDYAAQVSDEYLMSWTTQEIALIDVMKTSLTEYEMSSNMLRVLHDECGIPKKLIYALETPECKFKLNKDFHRSWLPCALPIALQHQNNISNGRSLLQQINPSTPVIIEHSQCTFMSTTAVIYNSGLNGNDKWGPNFRPNTPKPGVGDNGSADGSMWLILGGVAGGLLVSCLMVLVLYLYCLATPESSTTSFSRPMVEYKSA